MTEFDWWGRSLAGEKVEVHADAPQSGFYRMRKHKDGPWLPVMIRVHDGKLRCRVGDDSGIAPETIWTHCAGNPMSREAVAYAFKNGGRWENDAPAIGDNSGELPLAEQVQQYAAQALSWLKKFGIKDAKSKDMAANYRAELLKLSKEADASRVAEKKPHDDAAKAVQEKWKPVIDTADNAAGELRNALTNYMREEERKLEEERRAKWEAEQRAAAEARRAVEEQRAKQMADDPIAALTSPEPELPMAPPPPEPVKVQAGGQRGRKTGLREVTRFEVTDHVAALAFFASHEAIKETVEKLASMAGKAGIEVPGVKKITEKVAA